MRQYEAYKDSGVEWIGKIPSHWEKCALKRCLILKNGQDYKHVETEIGFPVYGSGGIFKYASKYLYDGKSVLFGRKGTIDKPLFVDGKFWTVDTMFFSVPQSNVDCKYMYYQSLTIPFNRYSTSTALPSMTQTDLGNHIICRPPLPEQQAIAAYLDEKTSQIDRIIESREKKIKLLEELKASIISNAVTKGIRKDVETKDSGIEWIGRIPKHWEVLPFKRVLRLRKGLTITKADLVDEGIPVISYGQIHAKFNDGVHTRKELFRFLPENYLQTDKNSLVKKGDFIFADTSEDLDGCGNNVRVDSDILLFAGYHSIIASPSNPEFSPYLSYLFKTNLWRHVIRSRVYGVKLYSVTQEILSKEFVIIPPLEEQKDIFIYLENQCSRIDKNIENAYHEISLLKEYRTSLITEVVTGKRKVI